MERYKVTLTGGPTGLLMHADDVIKADALQAYRGAAKAKGSGAKSSPGDDRTPPWSYWTYLYSDGTNVCLTVEQLAACLMKGATEFKMSGKKGKTLKAASQTLIRIVDSFWPLRVQQVGKKGLQPVPTADIFAIGQDASFDEHTKRCLELGIILDVRRAAVAQSKHVRVRPRFAPGWQASGEVQVIDETIIDSDTLAGIFDYCGDFVGLGDWRPSSPKKPGPHGRFTATVERL